MKLPKIKIPENLKSRKLWIAIGAGALVFCNRYFELKLTEEDLAKILTMLGAFIAVEGGADIVTRWKDAVK